MKKIILLAIVILVSGTYRNVMAQNTMNRTPAAFTGAVAEKDHYRAVYMLNTMDDKRIRGTIRNINNALEDPRLKGKLEVELVVFGDGVEAFKKSNHYDTLLNTLQNKGVILAQCLNTLKERKIDKDELLPFISYVPTGNGEIIIRQTQGWVMMHP